MPSIYTFTILLTLSTKLFPIPTYLALYERLVEVFKSEIFRDVYERLMVAFSGLRHMS